MDFELPLQGNLQGGSPLGYRKRAAIAVIKATEKILPLDIQHLKKP